jgi:hypothetical protein
MYLGNLLSIFPGTTIIKSIFQKVGSMAIYVRRSLGIQDGDMIWCNPDMSAEFLMGLVDCKIMMISCILEHSL